MNVVQIPTRANVDAAWDRYCALIRQSQDDPKLLLDREHAQAIILAHAEFSDAFLKARRSC